jgi:plastocyanin
MYDRTVVRMLGALALVVVTGSARAETIHVKMANVGYAPTQVSAHVGDTIEWENADIVAHTATARNKAWDVMILPNTKKSVVLKAAGTFDYYCKFHPNMTGQVIVAE